MMNQQLLDASLPMLRCPHCFKSGKLENNTELQQLDCSHCSSHYPYTNGYIDFLPYESSEAKGLAQKTMESPWVVNIYEDVFRPIFTALGSPIKYQQEQDWLQTHKAKGEVNYIVDLAAGTGRYTRLLADMYQAKIVFAVDISEPMLKACVENVEHGSYTNILAIRGDAHHLPFADGCIDYFNCFGALHLFPDPRQAINDMARIVRPGATFSCLTAVEMSSMPRRLLQKTFSRLAKFKFFGRQELGDILMGAGFVQLGALQKKMLLMFSAEKQIV